MFENVFDQTFSVIASYLRPTDIIYMKRTATITKKFIHNIESILSREFYESLSMNSTIPNTILLNLEIHSLLNPPAKKCDSDEYGPPKIQRTDSCCLVHPLYKDPNFYIRMGWKKTLSTFSEKHITNMLEYYLPQKLYVSIDGCGQLYKINTNKLVLCVWHGPKNFVFYNVNIIM